MSNKNPIQLESIPLTEENLLFPEIFIGRLGGRENAKNALLDIIDRYFNEEYIDECFFCDR